MRNVEIGDGFIAAEMGTTNGIEVSPDGKTLYVNESKQRNVWAFDLTKQGSISNKRLIKHFDDHGFDGMRCDVEGNLYITRHGKGTVIKMTPGGEILREIPVLGKRLSNLCFGVLTAERSQPKWTHNAWYSFALTSLVASESPAVHQRGLMIDRIRSTAVLNDRAAMTKLVWPLTSGWISS